MASQVLRTPTNRSLALFESSSSTFAMFAKLFTIASLAILAVATPTPGDGSAGNSCTTGPVQCCESIQKASDPAASKVLAAIGVVIQDIDALVGLTCSPISVVGVGSGNAWSVLNQSSFPDG